LKAFKIFKAAKPVVYDEIRPGVLENLQTGVIISIKKKEGSDRSEFTNCRTISLGNLPGNVRDKCFKKDVTR